MNTDSKYHVDTARVSEESEIILRAKSNPAAFEPLYNRYFEGIYRFVYQRMDDIDTAKDITQMAFIKALEKLNTYEDRGLPFSSWLYRIAYNELTQHFRNNSKNRCLNIDDAGLDELMEEMQEDRYEPYLDKLVDVLSQLEPENEALIEMRFFEKRSFKEIAEILDLTETNAKVRLYRLLDKIKLVITRVA
ncbi:MAG: sigma-70 family RNA polymerase sigma factor [Bacteroidetes bacterium]|nr:sigma-70 family RNA polymerase sigma factor [Bacteroidota bacterium]